MTSNDFRDCALALEGAVESSHMGHPDFRRGGKIFATLHYPDENWGMVKLSPEEQDDFVRSHSDAFVPVKGAWGRQGCTNVCLQKVNSEVLREALRLAWTKAVAPKPRPTVRKRASAKTPRV
jgi:hypothetical protein